MINNLPAVLVLVPLAAPSGPGAVLAVLLGVNIGPNLTYAGSLATLLWRRIVHHHEHDVALKEFTHLGLLTVPAALGLATVALWGSLQLVGGCTGGCARPARVGTEALGAPRIRSAWCASGTAPPPTRSPPRPCRR